jgi:hypothetical protein
MKYTSDVTMKITKEQFENDLKPSLIQMGRHDNTWGGWIEHPYVAVTSKNNKVGNYRGVDYPEYCIDHYNPELFLALAAMTDSENGNVGEYWKFIDTDYIGGNFTRGKIYKQDKSTINIYEAFIDNKGVGNGLSTSKGGNKSCFIKATKEEIITHFSKKILNNMKKLPEQFSVYARTKEEAVYICEKQKEMCGSTFSTPEKYMFYRFSPNRAYDKWGYNSTSYISYPSRLSEYNIQHEFTFEEFKSYFEEVNNKVCFKSDGTNEMGDKIINELERLGGKNVSSYSGNSNNRYYCINDKGNVDMEYDIPEGYTLTELPSEVKLSVGDLVKVKLDARYRTAIEGSWRNETMNGIRRREKQCIFKIEGDLVYVDYEDYKGANYIVVERENVELIESKIKEIKMKNRILTPQNATRIINIACSTWKPKLAEKWATNIVLNKDTEISEEFYQEMRKACTSEQNTLFDEIFGSDEQLIKISDLEIGEAMKIYDSNTRWDGIIISRIWSNDKPRYVNMNDRSITWDGSPTFKGKKVKLTITHEEIN